MEKIKATLLFELLSSNRSQSMFKIFRELLNILRLYWLCYVCLKARIHYMNNILNIDINEGL